MEGGEWSTMIVLTNKPQKIEAKTLMLWKKWEKLDHLEERLRVVEGGRDYAFIDVEELFLVPKHGHSQVQGVGLWQVQGNYLPQEPSKDVLSEDGGHTQDEKLLIHFSQESLTRATVT